MGKKGWLTLSGRQTDETGEMAVTEQRAEAEFFEKEGTTCLLYEEKAEDGGPVTKSLIKLKDSALVLTKQGGIRTRMIFEPGKTHLAEYATPCGHLRMELSTHSLEVCRDEARLEIRICYSLHSEGQLIFDCMLLLIFCQKNG